MTSLGGWEEKGEEELIQSRMNQAAAEWVEIIEPRTKVSRWIEIIEIISISKISLIIQSANIHWEQQELENGSSIRDPPLRKSQLQVESIHKMDCTHLT